MNTLFEYPLLLDGATGTALYNKGMPKGVCVENWVLENKSVIYEIQKGYIDAGSKAVYAPTFGANENALKKYGLADRCAQINKTLVSYSKEVCGDKALVGGDMSPCGLMLYPVGQADFDTVSDVFAAQAKALDEAGVDFFAVETMISLAEIKACVNGIRSVSDKPIFVTVTVDEKGKTIMGDSAESCLCVCQGIGVSAFGFNCSFGPKQMLEAVIRIKEYANIPLIAKPNAGVEITAGSFEYISSDEFAGYVAGFLENGVKIIGGCCGTNDEYIRKMRYEIDKYGRVPEHNLCAQTLACTQKEVYIINSETTFSHVINCDDDFLDNALCVSEDVVCVKIEDECQKNMFFDNVFMLNKPVKLICTDESLHSEIEKKYIGVFVK